MSMTMSVGVVGPSHWSYMAGTLAKRLDKIVRKKKIEANDIPVGVYIDANEFFELIVQALDEKLPENPPASMNAYMIAADIVKTAVRPNPVSPKDLEKHLARYSDFVQRLQKPKQLKTQDIITAKELRQFFSELQREGESEAYERRVTFDDLSLEPRLGFKSMSWRHC